MSWIADLHIHSRFSRATSGDCDAPHLDLWARNKGIALLGTGDFTHPQWREELREMLTEAEEGFYILKDEYRLPCAVREAALPRFAVTGEISTIYKRDGKTRKVHHVVILPGLDAAENLAHRLEAIGNLHSDGRPILGLDSRDLLEIVLESCPEAIYIPAHIWTPHFSMFGAFSGFDSIEECFGDLSPHIHALETGLSSDPPMNRRLSALDGHLLVSNSDAHSPAKLGREANLLSCSMNYSALKQAVETGESFDGTIEFYPEEGKYHLDGHRNCRCCLEPEETARLGGICPVCGKKVTVGVLNRVEALADREVPGTLDKTFESIIPLPEILGEVLGISSASKKTQETYLSLLHKLGPEFSILREKSIPEIEAAGGFLLGEAVKRMRLGRVIRQGGYDGEYGTIHVFHPGEKETLQGQTSLLAQIGTPGKKKVLPKQAAAVKQETPEAAAVSFTPNPEQAEAISAPEKAIAVVAGPGSGKTGTLVNRIIYMIHTMKISPREITAVTFTRQAAREMTERLEKSLGKKKTAGMTVGTFHSICLHLIDHKPLVSRESAREIMKALLRERKEKISPEKALALVSAAKNGLDSSGLPAGLLEQYQDALKNQGVRDLDDVLLEALDFPVQDMKMFRNLLVDEYQDINGVQRALVKHWAVGSVFVIGDPDQSIYGFRGAQAGCFEDFFKTWPEAKLIRLKQNYRSGPEIIECALKTISFNPGMPRELMPTKASCGAVRAVEAGDEGSQYIWISKEIGRLTGGVDMLEANQGERAQYAFSEIAVLCRTHRQLNEMEKCLNHDSIPCVVAGRGEYLEKEKNQALISFFTALEDPFDVISLHFAMKGLWNYQDSLINRAQDALPHSEPPGGEPLEQLLRPFDALDPFVKTVQLLRPLLKKEKPRKLLEMLVKETGIHGKEVEQLFNTAVFYDSMPDFLSALCAGEEGDVQRLSGGKPSGAVRLMTLHAAKGLEFPVVFLAGLDEGQLPMHRPQEEPDDEEERRLLYVGITRAREALILTCGNHPSPFLKDIKETVNWEKPNIRLKQSNARQMSFLDP